MVEARELPPLQYKIVRAATVEEFEPLLNAAAAEGWVLNSIVAGEVGPYGYPVLAVMEKKPPGSPTVDEAALGHAGKKP